MQPHDGRETHALPDLHGAQRLRLLRRLDAGALDRLVQQILEAGPAPLKPCGIDVGDVVGDHVDHLLLRLHARGSSTKSGVHGSSGEGGRRKREERREMAGRTALYCVWPTWPATVSRTPSIALMASRLAA